MEIELNISVVWNQMPPDVKMAFKGEPEKVKLHAGFRLYKFTEYFIANREGNITQWWSPLDEYGNDPGLASRLSLAKCMGTSASDLTRVVAGVKENWNGLTHILQAQLSKPVHGFWGQCSMQKRLDEGASTRPNIDHGPTCNLPGTAWQFYIPNLNADHIREISREKVA